MRASKLAGLAAMAVGIVCSSAGTVLAAVAVGDKPAVAFSDAITGKQVSTEQLKGKIIVLDFWATWCGPCMAEADHMIALNKKFAPEGLQMIGISLDSDVNAMKGVAESKGFSWPQMCDGKAWQTPYAQQFGVRGIPSTWIIGPDGAVLWSGHPAAIDAPLEKAFKEHPPVLVDPKLMAMGKEMLDSAETALKSGDAKTAAKQLAKVPSGTTADKAFAERLDKARKETDTAADALLKTVEPMVAQGQHLEAAAKLKELAEGLAGLPAGAKAKSQLDALLAKPEVKAKLNAAARAKTADGLLAEANNLKSSKKDEQAYPKFKTLANDYSDTPAGKQAATLVASYEKDAAFMKRLTDKEATQKANSALGVARSYKTAGRLDLAKKKYQSIISEFPGTSFADTAKKEMAALGG